MKEFFQRTRKGFSPAAREGDAAIPDNLWVKCVACREIIYQQQLLDNLKVCPKCGYHHRLSAREWLGLLDQASFTEHDATIWPTDPLGFENYPTKLTDAQERTGQSDVVISGLARLHEQPLHVAICNFEFMGASMGSVYGEKMARAAERAAEAGTPLLTINCSGGARMQEGVIGLMQMAKVSLALTRLARARQPHISLMVDPCYGGVTASYASVADIIIAESGANIGFAGKRVIESTIRQKLPADFQTAEFVLEHGMVDIVSARSDLRTTLGKLLRLYRSEPVAALTTAPVHGTNGRNGHHPAAEVPKL